MAVSNRRTADIAARQPGYTAAGLRTQIRPRILLEDLNPARRSGQGRLERVGCGRLLLELVEGLQVGAGHLLVVTKDGVAEGALQVKDIGIVSGLELEVDERTREGCVGAGAERQNLDGDA